MKSLLTLILVTLLPSCNAFWFDEHGAPIAIVTGDVGGSTDLTRQGRAGIVSTLDGTTSNQSAIDHTAVPGRIVMQGRSGETIIIEGLQNPIMSKLPDTITDITKIGAASRSLDNIVNKSASTSVKAINKIE